MFFSCSLLQKSSEWAPPRLQQKKSYFYMNTRVTIIYLYNTKKKFKVQLLSFYNTGLGNKVQVAVPIAIIKNFLYGDVWRMSFFCVSRQTAAG